MTILDIRERKGEERGKKTGIEIGEKRGEKRGEERAIIKIAINFLKMGFTEEQIAEGVELSIEEVKRLKKEVLN